MSSTNEKVKDLIEVRSFKSLQDFHSDPEETIEAYRFTDITAGLMAAWLDDVSRSSGSFLTTKALAGYRGVGKSHFLATFGAILANPELRIRVDNSHVSASAGGLLRRRYLVANVLRGTRETLLEEIRAAIAVAIGQPPGSAPRDFDGLLTAAEEKAGDMPFVILIDTAYERKSRVTRDDGQVLGELAAVAAGRNMFIAVALDDDITDADGSNSVIVQHYSVDYLDQEHLYRIVDAHIFPKNRLKQDEISRAYAYFREVIPDFRWSDRRFGALYPLHPLILEIAPVVRLYAPDFALLNFASEAGKRILGRPARSLIGLDEVFDCVEHTLRSDKNLADAFEIYDKISGEIAGLVPVFQRLQAKLILKALFILSLEGEGVTPGEVSAAILIYDENEPGGSIGKVADLLETFVSVFPDDFWRVEGHAEEIRYSLKVSGKDNLNNALSAAAKEVPAEAVPSVLKRVGRERYADWAFSGESDGASTDWTDIRTVWRGSVRRIRVFWNWYDDEADSLMMLGDRSEVDLFVVIDPEMQAAKVPDDLGAPFVRWNPAKLETGEADTIKRYFVLSNDASFRTEFADQIGPALHTHTVAVDKIWKRVFLTDSKIGIGGSEVPVPEEHINDTALADLLSALLEPVFEAEYPSHPIFGEPMGMREVSVIVSDLFSGARVGHQDVQKLAENFALPLGLVSKRGENFVLAKEESLFGLHLIEKILTLIAHDDDETVSLDAVYRRLKEKPYGLAREAQHLILSALVALGKIEFVTSKGDRISRRSLDLRIIWDDIAGISKPQNVLYGTARLTEWARIVTENPDLASIDISEDRKRVKDALVKWQEDWGASGITDRFEALDSDLLNTKIWNVALNVEKTFGMMNTVLTGFVDQTLSLEETLQRIADAFSDSESEFAARKADLLTIANFIEGSRLGESILAYLSLCEYTDIPEIERVRERIDALISDSIVSPSVETNTELETLFHEFRKSYAAHFASLHDRSLLSESLIEQTDEILASDEWWEFENLSRFPIFRQDHFSRASELIRKIRALDCELNVEEEIYHRPFCGCGFSFSHAESLKYLPKELINTVLQGADSYKRTLAAAADVLDPVLERLSGSYGGKGKDVCSDVRKKIRGEGGSAPFSTEELFVLEKACRLIVNPPPVRIGFPAPADSVTASELTRRVEIWLSELPGEPVVLKG